MKKEEKEVKISYWAAHATTIVSVSLVLVIAGIIALLGVAVERESRQLRSSLEVSMVMADSVSDASARGIMKGLGSEPFVESPKLITKAQALADWKASTGEDLEVLFGVNPLSPEIAFNLSPAYASADSIARVEKILMKLPGVEGVATPDRDLVGKMDSNMAKISIILGVLGVIMLLVSVVLINNTVHLTIYARRFLIHTMQLVGATNGFIRRPMVWSNALAGSLAGVLASGLLWVAFWLAPAAGFTDIGNYVTIPSLGIVSGGVVIAGAGICAFAAAGASTRYLRKDYNSLFK